MNDALQLPTNMQPVDPDTLPQGSHGFVLCQVKQFDTTDSLCITTNLSQTRTVFGRQFSFSVFTKGLDRNKRKSEQIQSFWLSPDDFTQDEIDDLCSEGCFLYMSPTGYAPDGCDEPVLRISQYKQFISTQQSTQESTSSQETASAPVQ